MAKASSVVAETAAGVSGYICFGLNPMTRSTWDIYWLAVAQSSRGQGFGRGLLTAAENHIKESSGRLVIIETSSTPDYDRTNRFYQRMSYKVVCQIADYYAPGDDKIIYEKRFK